MLVTKSFAAALLLAARLPAAAQSRQETLLNTDWKFTKGEQPDGAKPILNDGRWQTVRIPHDWAISGPFDGKNDLQAVQIEQNNEKAATLKAGRTGGLPFVGAPHHIRLVADRPRLAADGEDLAYLTARVEDAQDILCPEATQQLRFTVRGAGRFRAIANGDPTCLEPFQEPQMHAFRGQLVAIGQAAAAGLKLGSLQLTSAK